MTGGYRRIAGGRRSTGPVGGVDPLEEVESGVTPYPQFRAYPYMKSRGISRMGERVDPRYSRSEDGLTCFRVLFCFLSPSTFHLPPFNFAFNHIRK